MSPTNSNDSQTIPQIIAQSQELIQKTELDFCIPKGYLQTQVALHLPQFKLTDIIQRNYINKSLIVSECNRHGKKLEDDIKNIPDDFKKLVMAEKIPTNVINEGNGTIWEKNLNQPVNKIHFSEIDQEIGILIQERLHYMHNPRRDNLAHFGLYRDNEKFPFAYTSFSKLDRDYIAENLPRGITKNETLVLTRAYNINNSPYNTMSLLFSLSILKLQKMLPEIKAIVTAVNPNLLFSGTAFYASAFHPFMESPFSPTYYKGFYVTRKTVSAIPSGNLNHKTIDVAKFPLGPIVWSIRYISDRIKAKAEEDSRIKKIGYKTYSQG